ncbi:MAG: serine hydrolase [Ostreibacterium sp.]
MTHSPFSTLLSRRRFLSYTAVAGSSLLLPSIGFTTASDLQNQLNSSIQRQRRKGYLSHNERSAWSVYDFQTGQKLVAINEDRAMQAASMVKVFVALAYFYLNKQSPKKYPYITKQRRLMEKMLVHSNNHSTNIIMRLCRGPNNIKKLCQLATKNRFKQLNIVEYIPQGGRTYRNKVSAHDYSRFLYALWHNKLPHSTELKRVMSIKNRDRITSNRMSSGVTVFDKTGSTGMLCGDMGIVHLGGKKAYTFIGIIERSNKASNYSKWIRSRSHIVRETSELVYRFMDHRYRLLGNIG